MATVNAYTDFVKKVLDGSSKLPYAHGDLTCEASIDRPRG